jgi:hypothetical protein
MHEASFSLPQMRKPGHVEMHCASRQGSEIQDVGRKRIAGAIAGHWGEETSG